MAEVRREKQFAKDVLFEGAGKYSSVCFNPDNFSCAYPLDEQGLTRIFLKQATDERRFDVRHDFENVCRMVGVPVVVFDCHDDETNCKTVAVSVSNIGAYARKADCELTKVFLRDRTPDDVYFYVKETPEQIRDKIYAALSGARPDMR